MTRHNAIKCTRCGAVRVSLHRHDFQSCDCFDNGCFVDGGDAYRRVGQTYNGQVAEPTEAEIQKETERRRGDGA